MPLEGVFDEFKSYCTFPNIWSTMFRIWKLFIEHSTTLINSENLTCLLVLNRTLPYLSVPKMSNVLLFIAYCPKRVPSSCLPFLPAQSDSPARIPRPSSAKGQRRRPKIGGQGNHHHPSQLTVLVTCNNESYLIHMFQRAQSLIKGLFSTSRLTHQDHRSNKNFIEVTLRF